MDKKIFLQLHIHSSRSFDCNVPVSDYINYLQGVLQEDERAILGVCDHNVIPLTAAESLSLSTTKVLVVPGMQWSLAKSLKESLFKLCTRREIVTLGVHDGLRPFIKDRTDFGISDKDEILGNIREDDFLGYLAENDKIICIIPHPRHFFFEFYGRKEIAQLKQKFQERNLTQPLFIEEATGYDPFPRILHSYKKEYLTIGVSDAHEIFSIFGTNSLFSVTSSISNSPDIIKLWDETHKTKHIESYKELLDAVLKLLIKRNSEIRIKKYYFRSLVHFLRSVPLWFERRAEDFPKNLLK